MNIKEKFGIDYLNFYKLNPVSGREIMVCCLESCDEQSSFSSRDGVKVWKSEMLDNIELEDLINNLGKNGYINTNQVYCIDTGKFYVDLGALKKDTLVYVISGLMQGD